MHHTGYQRSVAGILAMVRHLGRMGDAAPEAYTPADDLEAPREAVRARAAVLPRRPHVDFQEWDEPQICGIRWVSELIAIAGGEGCFAGRVAAPEARSRIIADPNEAVDRAPEIIIGSGRGKRFRPERLRARVTRPSADRLERACPWFHRRPPPVAHGGASSLPVAGS